MDEKPSDLLSKFDPTRFAVDDSMDVGALGVERVLTSIPVRKPNKQEFFRTHPTLSLVAAVIELKDEREIYLLLPDVAAQMPGDFTLKRLSLCVTRQGNLFLWPVPVVDAESRANSWHQAAIQCSEMAGRSWIRMSANMAAGTYDIYRADKLEVEPRWPDKTMPEILQLAFGGGHLVEDLDHPLVRRLMGND